MREILQGWMAGNWAAACAAWLLLHFPGALFAHQDPWGDTHPKVSVVEGKFLIVFNNRLPDDPNSDVDERKVFRVIYNPDGAVFAPRNPMEAMCGVADIGPVGVSGRELKLGDDTLLFSSADRRKPGYYLKSPDGKNIPVRLPWPKDVSLSLFEDV
jgi:hypothetical protein